MTISMFRLCKNYDQDRSKFIKLQKTLLQPTFLREEARSSNFSISASSTGLSAEPVSNAFAYNTNPVSFTGK